MNQFIFMVTVMIPGDRRTKTIFYGTLTATDEYAARLKLEEWAKENNHYLGQIEISGVTSKTFQIEKHD